MPSEESMQVSLVEFYLTRKASFHHNARGVPCKSSNHSWTLHDVDAVAFSDFEIFEN